MFECFSQQSYSIGIRLIENHFDALPTEELLPHYINTTLKLIKKLEKNLSDYPVSLINQSTPFFKLIPSQKQKTIKLIHNLEAQLKHTLLLSIHLSNQGRYSFFSDFCISIFKAIPNSTFPLFN